jgi:SOS response regulatory protein OraA/RecX
MKTNQIMHRPFLNFTVRQMHKTGFINATDVTEIYNRIRTAEGKAPKRLTQYFENKDTAEFMTELCHELNLQGKSKGGDSCFSLLNPSDLKIIKRGKDNSGTWLHPYLFVDYAMWLNPKFRAKVVIWISDNLLFYRDSGGEAYKEMCHALDMKFGIGKKYWEYAKVARRIAYKVFGTEDIDQWNYGSQESQYKRETLQRRVISAVEFGNFRTVDDVINVI